MLQTALDDSAVIYTVIACVLYLGLLTAILRRFITSFSFGALVILTLIETGILIISRIPWPGAPEWKAFWHWFQSINGEYNLLATFSAAQLLVVGVTAITIAIWYSRGAWYVRAYWVLVFLVFLAMTADEYYQLHEGHQWIPIYATVGGILVMASVIVFWREGDWSQQLPVYALLFGGLGLMAAGGMALETAAAEKCSGFPSWFNACKELPYVEEALEIVGISLSLAGVLTYAQRHITAPQTWRRARMTLAAGSAGGILILLASFWIVPRLEAHFLADDVDVTYFDNQLTLVGYHTSKNAFRPGDTITIDAFWQTSDWVLSDFNMTAQLLTFPDAQLVAEEQVLILDPPASSWLPGMVRKQSATLTIPDDVATPASLIVTVALWDKRGEEIHQIEVKQSSVQTFNDYLPLLKHITVLPEHDVSAPPDSVRACFGSDFDLEGVTLPAEITATIDATFWWSSDADLDRDLVQLFHLYAIDSDQYFIFDQTPFGGRFPTSDWVDDMHVMDTWTLTLPDDMPAGDYRVLTGMYDAHTLQRESATDCHGHPFQDNLIELGIVHKVE